MKRNARQVVLEYYSISVTAADIEDRCLKNNTQLTSEDSEKAIRIQIIQERIAALLKKSLFVYNLKGMATE